MVAAIVALLAVAFVAVPMDESDAEITSVDYQVNPANGNGYLFIYVSDSGSANVTVSGNDYNSTQNGLPIQNGRVVYMANGELADGVYTIQVTVGTNNYSTTYTVGNSTDPDEYTVTITQPDNGTISVVDADDNPVESGATVAAGSVLTATVNADSGYHIDGEASWTITVNSDDDAQISLPNDIKIVPDSSETPQVAIEIDTIENATISVMNGDVQVNDGDLVDVGTPLTVTVTPAQGYKVVGENPFTVTVSEGMGPITATVQPINDPTEEDPAERPFTNTITLSDGAVIDASSSINASYTQEVIIAGDVTVAAKGYLDISGKLTVQEDAVLTIEEGGNVYIQKDGIVDIQGDLVAEAGADEATFQYRGCLMTVAGSVTLEGTDSFATDSTAKKIQISGTFEVGDEATAVLNETTVAEGGELLVYGVVTGTVANSGSVVVDSQGLADGSMVYMTVQLKATGTVDVTNVHGTVVVTDSGLTFTEKKVQVEVDNDNTVTLNDVAGVTVSENLVIEKNEDDDKNHGINTMLVAGGISVADDYNSSANLAGKVTVAGDKVEITESVTLGEGVTLEIAGDLTVSGEVAAIDGAITGNGGSITVTGKVTTAAAITGTDINAALYETERVGTNPVYNVYTTLETALTDGAVSIDLLGKNTIEGAATIPVGTTVDMDDGATLTIGKDASLTIESDDRKSGKLNTATGAIDKVVVDGTMDVQNFAKSGIKLDAVLSDTSKEVEDSMSFTNVYNALENAADGETVKITRGVELTLKQNVDINTGVTLLIPAGENVVVDHGITVTVDGTLVNQGTYDIADEIQDNEETTENEYKAAGVTVVNGMFMAVDTSLYTGEIVGAYFEYTYDKKDIDAIAPLASLPAIAADIGSDIYLYGQMNLGEIDFSAYDGEGALETIFAVNDLTIGGLTLGNVVFDATNAAAVVNGTIVLANGTVDLNNVNGIIAQNSVDSDDVVTSAISGTVTAVQDDEVEGEETATVTIGGEIASSMTTQRLVTFDVPAGATATMTAGTIADAAVAGEMVIAQNGVTFDVLSVTGTVTAEENFSATAKALYVGVTSKDLAMAGTGDVSGIAIATGNESVAYVSPNATIAEDIVKNLKSTAYYVDDALYVTAYANNGNAVKIDIPFTVENAFFDAWQYEDEQGKMQDVSGTDMVGSPIEEVHAKIIREIYNVMVTVDGGIGTVAIDGNVLVNVGGNVYATTAPLAAGQHTISYTLKSGYEGEATLTVNGEGATVSGMNFTLAGNPADDATEDNYEITVQLSLSGTTPGDTTVVIDNGGDDGLGLTDYLLIILVVLIVIMAIIVALRLMRS